ncbi:hypothetical protein L1887_58131 [Cichorium endivia]|nr:hypothetical protein L1887_58131 [Cichorium endivia]
MLTLSLSCRISVIGQEHLVGAVYRSDPLAARQGRSGPGPAGDVSGRAAGTTHRTRADSACRSGHDRSVPGAAARKHVDQVAILDPLIATGGTAVVSLMSAPCLILALTNVLTACGGTMLQACIQMILDWGIPVDKIKFLCVLASQKGLEHVTESVPGLEIWVGHVDPELSEKGLILPGLGDTGDRMFDTLT